VKAYYDRRAPEYDDWYLGLGHFEGLDRPDWENELDRLITALAALPPAVTLDVGCGTGFLTRYLPGVLTGLDSSDAMLAIARERVPAAEFVRGDGLALPFADDAFDRVFTAHFYGHLDSRERARFLAEARRVGGELVIVDSAVRPGVEPESVEERILNDGSRWTVLKRYFTPEGLAAELGGGRTLHAGSWFVAVAA
jgi:ubiquinone/menaquinone biosynthesis C-methylase UbiE